MDGRQTLSRKVAISPRFSWNVIACGKKQVPQRHIGTIIVSVGTTTWVSFPTTSKLFYPTHLWELRTLEDQRWSQRHA